MCLVDVTTGRLSLEQVDLTLEGPVPLELFRLYRSTGLWLGDLGWGWSHAFGYQLREREPGQLVFRGGDGRRIFLPVPAPGAPSSADTEGVFVEALPPDRLPWEDLREELSHGAYLLQRAGRQTLLFDARAGLGLKPWRAVVHASGALLRVDPDVTGLPARVEDPTGRVLHLTRRADGLLAEIAVSQGRDGRRQALLRYDYSDEMDLVAVHDAAGTRTFEYEDHRLQVHRDRAGGTCTSSYDAYGRCVGTSGPGGVRARSYRFDADGSRTTVTDSLGHEWAYSYLPGEKVVEVRDRIGGTSRFDYDALGRLVRSTDQVGRETSICYDGRGAHRGKIAPDGEVWTVAEEPTRATLTSPSGAQTSYERDGRGLITARTAPGVGTARVAYGPDGRIAALTLPTGRVVRHAWSDDGRVLVESDDHGLVSERHYDLLQRLVLHKDASGATTGYRYGGDGRLADIVRPDGRTRHFEYDAEGRVVLARDEAGNVARWQFDAAGRSVISEGVNGQAYRSVYDTEDRLVAVQSPDGLWHRYEYDPEGRVVRQAFSDGRVEQYAYDATGLLVAMTDGAGETVTIDRDLVGRHTGIHYPDGTEKRITYDADGRWLAISHAGHTRRRTLSPEGLVLLEQQDDESWFRREFGKASELRAVTDAHGRRIEYDYDDAGRVTEARVFRGRWEVASEGAEPRWIADGGARRHGFSYDRTGNVVVWRMPGGKVERRSHDPRGRLLTQVVSVGDVPVLARDYRYDALGRLVQLRDSRRGTTTYDYDALGRLVEVATDGRVERFTYDAAGDIQLPGASYLPGHRVQTARGYRLTYDARGYLVQRDSTAGSVRFAYSGPGLLREAVASDGGRTDFEYDPWGRLVLTHDRRGTTRLLWCSDWLWAIERPDAIAWFVTAPGVSEPLEQHTATTAYSIHVDHIGRVRELVDDAGRVVWEDRSGVWAETRGADAEAGGRRLCPLGFPGQIYEPGTALWYNRFRFYFAETAHYTTPDPGGIWGGLDAYAYTADPVNHFDPLGLICRNKTDDPALYRADRRPPEQICSEGFQQWNPNGTASLVEHVNGSNQDTPWISTTYDRQSAHDSKDYGDRYDADINQKYPGRAGAWIYEIENPGCGVEVDCDPGVIAHEAQFGGVPSEQEIAFKKPIPPDKIVGAYNLDTGEMVVC